MPGGQYTNLREQLESMGLGALEEVARTYAEVNDLFGDIGASPARWWAT